MKRRIGGQLVDTHRYVITFNLTKLPQIITLTEWHREPIELYIPKPI